MSRLLDSQETILHALRRPLMYGARENYGEIVSLLCGMDSLRDRAPLLGFEEWLIVKFNFEATNIHWSRLVIHAAGLPYSGDPRSWNLDEAQDAAARECLKQLIAEFFDILSNDRRKGLRRIHVEYQKWLWKQEWYDENSPDYISPP